MSVHRVEDQTEPSQTVEQIALLVAREIEQHEVLAGLRPAALRGNDHVDPALSREAREFRRPHVFRELEPDGVVRVAEAMAATPEAMRAIWRYLLDLDWCATIKAGFLPVDHPLFLLSAEPRRMRTQLRDGCFARLVDVEAALRARKYGPGEIVIEIADIFCPWNTARWLVREDGATRTDRAADISCDVSALASAYLGGFSWAQIVASCRANAASEEAVARADRVFEQRGAPWVPEIF